MDTEQEGFEVVDKRRPVDTGSDEPIENTTIGEEQAPEAPVGEEAVDEPGPESTTEDEPDVPGLLLYMLSLLGATSWQHLGLIMSPATNTIEQDLPQARLAIDTFEVVLEKLTPHVEDEVTKQLRASLADLKLNYVERSRKSG